MLRFFIIMFLLINSQVFAYDGKSLPAPKAIPASKALPKPKALPSVKSAPKARPVPRTKRLPSAKALPIPKKLVLKPVFGSGSIVTAESEGFDPRFDPPPLQSQGESKQLILQEGVLNFLLNGSPYGDIRIVTDEKMEKIFLSKSTLMEHFDGYLMPEIYQQIDLYLRGRKWLDKNELVNMGFDLRVNTDELIIDVTVPATYRPVKIKELGGTLVQARTIDIKPAYRSASLTPYWSRIWRDKISVTNEVNLDAAISYDSWVLENDSAYDLNRGLHRRKTTRIVRDFPSQVTRVTAGDVEYKTIGLMGRKALGGVNVSREFSLKPNLLTTPISHQRIFLKNDATVRVFINDIPRQSFNLSAGYYDLRDFPFIDGLNFVRIEITDIYGQVTTHEYLGFDNKKVLIPSVIDYSVTGGFERIVDEIDSTRYDFSEPAWSGYIRKGIHKNYTLGALTEGDSRFLSFGGYGVTTGVYGTLEGSSLFSANVNGSGQLGMGLSVNYFFATAQFTFSNTAYWKSKNFSYLGKNDYSLLQQYYLSSRVGLPIPYFKRWRQNYSVRFEQKWNGVQQARAAAKLSGRISKHYTMSADVFYSRNENNIPQDAGFTLTLHWYPQKRLSVSALYDSQVNAQQLDVSRGPGGEQGLSMNASFADNETLSRANGGVEWKTQYFKTHYRGSVSQEKTLSNPAPENIRRYETFGLSNSFVWVDNVFAMGPPIKNGSFVVFKSGEGLGNGRIAIGRNGNEMDRESMPFIKGADSTALFTNLNQYSTTTAHLLPYLEDGYIGLDKRKYRIFSGYRSGALVTVSKQVKMYGSGVLANREWQPIASIKGTFYHLKTKQKHRFFTDEEGYFEVDNLQPGDYRIILDNRRGSGEVQVKASSNNFIDFGILNLKGAY